MPRREPSAHDIHIAKRRRETKAEPVRLGSVPPWARQAIRASYVRDGVKRPTEVILRLINDARFHGLFDHWGSSQKRGERSRLVTEPYPSEDLIGTALSFSLWTGMSMVIDKPTWWYPDNTIRIEFHANFGGL